jgi:VanZ family protein
MKWGVILGILVQILFLLIGTLRGTYGFFPDNVLFIVFLLIAWKWYDAMRLNEGLVVAVNGYFVLHSLGLFGGYNWHFAGIPFDKVVHFSGYCMLTVFLVHWSGLESPLLRKKNAGMIALIMFTAVGVGAVNEIAEYTGYRLFGVGDGFFLLGAGDGDPSLAYKFQGSWDDSMKDMIANIVGVCAGILLTGVRKSTLPLQNSQTPS